MPPDVSIVDRAAGPSDAITASSTGVPNQDFPGKIEVESLQLALPKGRMQQGVFDLLRDAGIKIDVGNRAYRPTISGAALQPKLLKPQNIIEMLHVGRRDIGFAGADWVAELDADVVEVLDTELDPVRLVVAAPAPVLEVGEFGARRLLIATEYIELARRWMQSRSLDCQLVRSFGATEVFPPEDADAIIDITQTGSTLAANNLVIAEEIMRSSTRLYASRSALDNPVKRQRIEEIAMLLQSVIDARRRVMVELNVAAARLDKLVALLPAMRQPTIATLTNDSGFAVKVAVPRTELPRLIPTIKAAGGTDIVVSKIAQIIA